MTANLWHSCADISLDAHFTKNPALRQLFDAWLAFVAEHGDVTVSPNRTRISIMAQTRFAGCEVRKDSLKCSFVLERRVSDARLTAKEEAPGLWVHRFVLRDVSELDDELRVLVQESYHRYGLRERLAE